MTQEEKIQKARELLSEFRSGMLVTHGDDGYPHARPMVLAQVDDDCSIRFITSLDSKKVEEVRRSDRVGLTLQSKGAFVSVSGRARLETNVEAKRAAWDPFAGLWFQEPDDPDAALLILEPELLEYWDERGVNAVGFAFEAIRAAATGEKPGSQGRAHATVPLGH